MNKATEGVLAIVSMIVGLAIVAILISKNANTSGVINSATSGLGALIKVAVSPVSENATGMGSSFGGGIQSGVNQMFQGLWN